MKVVEDGPDIPDELITAQERGQTLFICGAGVSLGAGLPTFRGLVAGVYEHLHEQWQHHHAEREGMEQDGRLYGQYDRVLRCLERRLGGPNPQRNRRMRSRIRSAVRACLQPPPAPDLSNHLALFDLSCDEVGNSRILTTNFDTLFERAVKASRGTPPPSHSGVALPQPKSPNFGGVLHLHGRLADADLNLEETDLVLTSAEFGDAYLRTGWASRYVYDLVRTHTVVLVGYQADDPPMRYLLEALEADRERYADLKRVYAFAPSDPGEETLEGELWRAKGVEPIIYQKDGNDHSKLYVSLREWQSYAKDPTLWRQHRLEAIFANALETANESVRNECVKLLSHHDATELLGALSPDPEWLPFLTSKGVFKSGTTHLGLWSSSRIAEPDMIRQVAGSPVLDDTSRWHLERALEKTGPDLPDVFRRAWRLIIRESIVSASRLSRHGWFEIEPQLALGEVGYSERATITGIFKPQLRVEKPYRFREEQEDSGNHSLRTLVRIDFASGDYPHPQEVLSALPSQPEIERELLLSLDRALLDSLEEAHDVGFLDGWDAASGDVPSVAPHRQNIYRSGFYPIVRMMADLWVRLAANDPPAARTIAMRWAEGRWPLIKRLWLFAAENDLISPDEVADALLKTGDDDFWISNTVVEVMRAMTARWSAFPEEKRELLETRIRNGVPRSLYMDDLEEDRWMSIHESSIFRRLSRLKAAGCHLSDESAVRLTEIVAANPEWQAGEGDRDDFNSWSESSTGPEGDPKQLSGVPDENLVAEAKRLRREERHRQGDVWRMFAASDPQRALRGLLADAESGVWESAEWRDLINVAVQVDLGAFQTELALAILDSPDLLFEEQQGRIASWLRAKRAVLCKEGAANSYFAIWDLGGSCLSRTWYYQTRRREGLDVRGP